MQMFGVGLFRTGTNSIFEMFRRSFRADHEFMKTETLTAISDHMRGSMPREDFIRFVGNRTLRANLEMDSAGFHFFYLDVLTREFPASKMILTIRDCYSWVNSFMALIVAKESTDDSRFISSFLNCIDPLPDSRFEWNERTGFKCSIEQLVRIWNAANVNVLTTVPPERLLVVKLPDLSRSLERIAGFAGVPVESLDPFHCNKTDVPVNYLAAFDGGDLEALAERYCSELMSGLFPGFTLTQFAQETAWAKVPDAAVVNRVFSLGWERVAVSG
jgi:hypothetical protein